MIIGQYTLLHIVQSFFISTLNMGRSCDHAQSFVEDILDIPIPLTQDISEHPDSLEHVDAVEPEDEPAVLSDIG